MAIKQNRAIDPNDFLSKTGEGRTIRTYRKGQIVFSQGDQADAVFYIQQGMTKASVVSEHGKEAIVAILGAGEFFGEKCLGGHPQRLTTVTAIMESTIARVEKTAMVRMLNNEAAFSEMFIACLVDQVTRAEENLADQLFNSSEKRLARMLLLLTNFDQEEISEPIIPAISQGTLAEMVGTTRARVSFFMNKFRKLGYIDYKGEIRVHRSLLNIVLYGRSNTKAPNH